MLNFHAPSDSGDPDIAAR
jgi:MFS family permease